MVLNDGKDENENKNSCHRCPLVRRGDIKDLLLKPAWMTVPGMWDFAKMPPMTISAHYGSHPNPADADEALEALDESHVMNDQKQEFINDDLTHQSTILPSPVTCRGEACSTSVTGETSARQSSCPSDVDENHQTGDHVIDLPRVSCLPDLSVRVYISEGTTVPLGDSKKHYEESVPSEDSDYESINEIEDNVLNSPNNKERDFMSKPISSCEIGENLFSTQESTETVTHKDKNNQLNTSQEHLIQELLSCYLESKALKSVVTQCGKLLKLK